LSRHPDPARHARASEILEALVADLPVGHSLASSARDFLARLLLESGRVERASQVAAVSANSTNSEAIVLYAQTLIQSKRPEAAEWQLDRFAAINPGDPREAK